MELAYFDSSALVKLVVLEEESDLAASLRDGAEEVASSELAYVEVRAALEAARRDNRLDARTFRLAKQRWEDVWTATASIAPTAELIREAGDLAERYALRGYDAMHLASALSLAEDAPVVASWDTRMRSGAIAARLRVAPATSS